MDYLLIGKRIRKQREYLGFTREQFAELIDVTTKFCSDIELGQKGMSLTTLCRISSVLNVSLDYIIFGKENESNTSSIIEMIKRCPQDKIEHLESIIKAFLLAVNEN